MAGAWVMPLRKPLSRQRPDLLPLRRKHELESIRIPHPEHAHAPWHVYRLGVDRTAARLYPLGDLVDAGLRGLFDPAGERLSVTLVPVVIS